MGVERASGGVVRTRTIWDEDAGMYVALVPQSRAAGYWVTYLESVSPDELGMTAADRGALMLAYAGDDGP